MRSSSTLAATTPVSRGWPHPAHSARLRRLPGVAEVRRVVLFLGRSRWFGPLLAALLSFVAWQPFVRPDFDIWKADDGEYHLLRVYVFEAAFRAGEWLPRWTPDLFVGYGYPIFNYYAPGTYYVALAFRLLGLSVFGTVQTLGALAACVGAAGAFCCARALFRGFWPAVVAALLYVYAPYPFITNLLIRADLAEALGLAFLPWALLAAWHAGRQPRARHLLGLILAVGAIILTHNLTALMALPAALAVGVLGATGAPASHRRQGLVCVGGGVALALALTAFFWVPALAEQRYVQIEVALNGGDKSATSWLIDPLGATAQTKRGGNPQTAQGPLDLHLSYPYNLNYPPKPTVVQGIVAVLAVLAVGWAVLRRRTRWREAGFFLAGTALLWLCTTTWSTWVWQHVPLMRFLQFSWRLYGPLSLALALLAAGAAAVWRTRGGQLAFVVLAVLLAVNTTTARELWINPAVEHEVSGPQLVGTENALFGAGTTTGGEFVPRTVDFASGNGTQRRGNGTYEQLYPEFGWLAGRVEALAGQVHITGLWGGVTWTTARVHADSDGQLAFHTVAFPGWRAYLDGHPVTPELAPRDAVLNVAPGFLVVPVPAGDHQVEIAFGPTRLRTLCAAASVLALAWLSWWLGTRLPITKWGRGGTWLRLRRVLPALVMVPAALFGLAVMHDALRPVFGAPVVPHVGDTLLEGNLLDLMAHPAAGQVTISSPSGPALGQFVNLARVTLNGREREWLYMHPSSSVSYILDLPQRAAFQAGLGMDPRVWTAPTGDGVTFIVEVTPLAANGSTSGVTGPTVRVLDEHLNPRAFEDQRRWLDRWVDLSAFGGQRVRLTLRTDPGGTVDYDWAGWADPAIIVQHAARRPGGGPPAPLPTPRAS